MRSLSLRSRLTLWYTLALLVVLCLCGATVLWQLRRIGIRRVDRDLEGLSATLVNVMRDELTEMDDPVTAAVEATGTVNAPRYALAIFDAAGTRLSARWNGLEVSDRWPGHDALPHIWSVQTRTGDWRVHGRSETVGGLPLVLVVGSPLAEVLREQHELEEAMIVGIPIVLLLAAAGGLWLASVGLQPITEMARRAARIPPSGLEDLGQTGRSDELGQLAAAFNGLVARLRVALRTQRQFMTDASHELRTPVSVVRATADVMLSGEHRDEVEYREAMMVVGDQARRLGTLVEDMLVLARADAGGYPLRPVNLYLNDIVAECCRALHILATERGVTIRSTATPDIPFRGDEDLLRRLVLNVLQNGVQHSPANGSVLVDIGQDSDTIRIRVTNDGPGIPPSDQQRIFDRFVQLDPARRGHGAGLGLPIGRWIAEAHGGVLLLERSGQDGTTFCVALPIAAA